MYQLKSTQSKTNVRFDKLKSQMDRMEHMIARIAESQNPEYRVMPSDSDSSLYSVGSTGGEEGTIDLAEQNESLKGSIEDEQAGELPDFNDRLEQLMLNQTAGNLDSLMYTSGIFLSILSPNEVESLSRKMHNPNTIIWLSKTSNLIWRLQQRSMMMLVEVSDQEIDPEFAQFCMGLHRQVLSDLNTRFGSDFRNKFIPASLISNDDISPEQFPNWPVHLRRGIIAALVLEGAVILKMSAPNKRTRWSDEYISKQQRIAFQHCINLLNIVKFSRPSYMLAKTCSFIICHVSKFFCVPAILAFLDSLLDLARSLALNSEAVNSKLPEAKAKERLYLWDMIIRGYNQQMICRLSTPKIGDIPFIKSWGSEFESGNDGMKNIYLRCRKKLFGLYKNRSVPRSDIYKEIVRSGAELDEWWKNWCEKKKSIHTSTDKNNANTTSKGKKRRSTANSSERLQNGSTDSDGPAFVVGLATNEYIDIAIKSFHIQLYREYLLTKLIIYSIPAFYPQYLPESVPNALGIVQQTAHDLLLLAVDETKSVGVCYDAMTLCTTAAIGALLFKQLKHPENPTNKEDIEFLKSNVPLLNAESWPSVVDGQSAMMELWTALLHIMVKVYEFKDSPPSDNSGSTITPGSLGSDSTDSNSSQSLLHQTTGGSASSLQFANFIHNQQQQQQRSQNIMHSGIGQIQNVPSASYYGHGSPAPDSMMRQGRGYTNHPQFIKSEAEMAGPGGLPSPNSSGSTPSVASNGSYMSVQSVPSPPVPMPMTHAHTFPPGNRITSDTIDTRAMLPQHINRRLSHGTPINMGFQNVGAGRDDYTNDHQQGTYGAQFPSRQSTSSYGSYMPTVEEQSGNEIHPGQEIYDFESMVDNNPDLILRDVEQPENCSIA